MSDRPRQIALPKGSVVFSPGQPCPGFVQLRSGTIRVTLTAENGREVVLYRVAPGDVCLQTFSCLINDETYSAYGVAETDLEGVVLPPEAFRRKLAEEDQFRSTVFTAVARRFQDFERLVEDVALTGLNARLARALLRLGGEEGRVRKTHDELAAEVASGRAVITRRLADFARDGLVTLERGAIHLSDRAGLERIAAGSA